MNVLIDSFYHYFNDNILVLSFLLIVLSFIMSYRIFPVISYVSIIKNLTAKPNERSSHKNKIPHLGGIGVSFGSFFICAFFASYMLDKKEMSILLSIASALVLIFSAGIKDDIIGLSPRLKLFIEISSSFIFIMLTDIRIDSFYGFFGVYDLPKIASYIYTIFVFVVIINSYNLVDGIDGLAASIAIIILSFYLYYFINIKSYLAIICCAPMLGGILAFLRFNILNDKNKIFMGDVGALVIGYMLAVFTTMILSSEFTSEEFIPNKPVFVLALFAYPFLDTLRVFIVRGFSGKSPFLADKNHFHHKLLDLGFSHIKSTIFIITYCLIIIIFSYLFFNPIILNHFFSILTLSIVLLTLMIWCVSKIKVKK